MGIIRKGNKLYGMFKFKCPRCHEGDLFETPTFSFRKPFEMYDRCPVCDKNYLPEPGYYYGAMFVSYIFTGFFCLGFVMFFHWVLDWSTEASFALLIAVGALGFVLIFRLARSIYINLDQPYDKTYSKAK
jgi:uncharacterized protein (DUF983 family)